MAPSRGTAGGEAEVPHRSAAGEPANAGAAGCAVCASVAEADARSGAAVTIAADVAGLTLAPRAHVPRISALPRPEMAAVLADVSWLTTELRRRTGAEVQVGTVGGPHVTLRLTVDGPGLPPSAVRDVADGLVDRPA